VQNSWTIINKLFLDAVCEVFKKDFLNTENVLFFGNKIVIVPGGSKKEKFEHLVTEEKYKGVREYSIERCERIKWPRFIIENCNELNIKYWKEKRKKQRERVCLCYGEWEYLVILEKTKGEYLIIITAYPLKYKSKIEDCKKQYMGYGMGYKFDKMK
jgi:hypothetical protein